MSAKLHVERNKRPELWPLVTTSHFASSSSLPLLPRLSLSRARASPVRRRFFSALLLLSSTLCCAQNATWVSLIVFISTSNQANKEWVFHLPFFFGFLGVPLTTELSFWCRFAAGDGMAGAGSVGMGFFCFPKVGVDPNLVVLPSSWATVVYVFSSAAAAAAFLPMQGSMKLRIGRTPPQQQLNLRIELWKV